jgi:DNA-binding transcriptional LysR family regulator
MDFRQLRYFVAVAEERHFRRAAERLHMSQPPLSQQIQALERELNTKLLARDRRSVSLTAAGQAFLRRARGLLDQADGAAIEARQIGRGDLGRLVIGFMSAAMLSRFPPMLGALRSANPAVDVELVQLPPREQIEAVAAGRIDLGFLAVVPSKPILIDRIPVHFEQLWEEELVAALPVDHRLSGRSTIPLSSLAGEPFITLQRLPQTGHYDQVHSLCQKHGRFRVNIKQEVEQLPAALALIAAGHGVSLIPACAMDGWRDLVAFPRLKERPRIPVTMVWRPDNVSPVLAVFRNILISQRRSVFFPAVARATRLTRAHFVPLQNRH